MKSVVHSLIAIAAFLTIMKLLVLLLEPRLTFFPYREIDRTPADFGIEYQELSFPTSDGETLSAWFLDQLNPLANLVFFHGNGGNISVGCMDYLVTLHRHGYSVFVFDYRGYGKSSGSPSEEGFYLDSRAAVSYFWKRLHRNYDLVLYLGHSLGGVAAACAAAGVVVGVASLTGIGLRMSELIISVSQGNLLLALLLTAMGSIVLGMGLPTTAAYVVLAALGAPALIELGVPMLAAHLFIFYFGCISNVTPPVSLAAYAASGIAGSPPLKTAWTAMLLASAGFFVPFSFVYAPPLLLQGSVLEIGLVAGTGIAGVTALAAAAMGFLRRNLSVWERLLLLTAAFALIFPGLTSDGYGLLILVVIFLRPGSETERA